MSQYIGKTISLISNKGVRYVGLLYNISAEDATVALQSVRSFGTEGRMAEQGQPNLEVLPGSDVYDYVTFRGSDVKDLSVLDLPLDQVQPVTYQPPALGVAPAPTATSQLQPMRNPAQPQSVPATTTDTTNKSVNTLAAAPVAAAAPTQPEPTRTSATSSAATTTKKPQSNKEPTRSTGDQFTRTQGAPNAAPGSVPQPVAKTVPESTDGDFDFERANARFQKEGKEEMPATSVYNKSTSFFDSISLNEHGNMRWSEEKNLNMDTFGESSVRRGRGNWRGRGRGRGNWRGRGGQRGRGRPDAKPEWA